MRPARLPWILGAVVAVLGLSAVAAADDAADKGLEEARKHFKAGVAYLEDPEGARFEEAYAEFKKVYDLSKSPKVLGNLGLCAMKLERDGEAIEAYGRYLKEVSDIDPEERTQSERDLQTLTASAARVRITFDARTKLNPAGLTLTDTRIPTRGSNIVNVYAAGLQATDLVIRPGRHTLRLEMSGHDRGAWEFTASPGARLTHVFVVEDAAAAKPPPAPSRVGPILLMGLGGAALVAGGVIGIATLSKVHALEDECPNDVCPDASFQDDVSSARTYVRATDYLLLGGGVVAAVGLGWLIFSSGSSPPEAPRAAVQATCGPSGCAGSMRVRF